MMGVVKYPYSQTQRLYLDDFRAMVSSTISHPFVTTALAGSGSVPFNLLSGSNFDDDKLGGTRSKWISEQERSYTWKDFYVAKKALGVGVRSECVQFLG